MITIEQLEQYKKELNTNNNLIKKLPEGHLGYTDKPRRYYQVISKNNVTTKKGITNNKKMITALIQKKVLLELNKEYAKIIKAAPSNLSDFDPVTIGSVIEKLKPPYSGFDFKQCNPFYTPQSEWAEAEYNKNPMNPEQLKYLTQTGVLVRSKSERFIANILTKLNLEYRYEQELTLTIPSSSDNCESTTIEKKFYPDFTVYNPKNDKYYYIEHLGLIKEKAYALHTIEKLKQYNASDIITFDDNLILTFESDLLDLALLEDILKIKLNV